MKKAFTFLIFLTQFLYGQYQNGEELLKAMHDKYNGKYCQTVQFDQRIIGYAKNGAVRDTSYWYEWISYPDKFRIDFEKKLGGNCFIFKSDSFFNYSEHMLKNKKPYMNGILLFWGRMYFRSFDDVVSRAEKQGLDLDKLSLINVNNKSFYVISSSTVDTLNKQEVWVDKKDLKVVRMKLLFDETTLFEFRFDDIKKACKGFTETKVSIYSKGKLTQKEEYLNLKTNIAIPDSIFNKK